MHIDAKYVVVIGAGGHGSEVVSYIRNLSKDHDLRLLGVIDDKRAAGPWNGTTVLGSPQVLGELSLKFGKVHYITAVGNNVIRKDLVDRIKSLASLEPALLVHSTACIGQNCKIGEGTLVAPQTIVTTNATIGSHCILNVKVSISHDVFVEDWCNLNPGCTLTGNVYIEEGAFIGAGATILPGVRVGKWATVGGGSLVNRDVPAYSTVVGVPARVIKSPPLAQVGGRKS